MTNPDHVLYFPGLPTRSGEQLAEREALPELWLPHGIEVEMLDIDYAQANCEEIVTHAEERLTQLHADGRRASLMADSGGGKIDLIVAARNPELIHRNVLVCVKVEPYEGLNPKVGELFPLLVQSSDTLALELDNITDEVRAKTLYICGEEDDEIDPSTSVLEGAQQSIIPTRNHSDNLAYALRAGNQISRDFIQQS